MADPTLHSTVHFTFPPADCDIQKTLGYTRASTVDVMDTHTAANYSETTYLPHQYSLVLTAQQQAELQWTSLGHFPFPCLIHPHTSCVCACYISGLLWWSGYFLLKCMAGSTGNITHCFGHLAAGRNFRHSDISYKKLFVVCPSIYSMHELMNKLIQQWFPP